VSIFNLSADDLKRLDVQAMDGIETLTDVRKAIADGNPDKALAHMMLLAMTLGMNTKKLIPQLKDSHDPYSSRFE
jgi:hypothetical protein